MKLFFYSLILTFIFNNCFAQSSAPLKWEVGYHKLENETPAKWLAATVPGAVELDVMVGEKYKQPIYYADNYKQFTWMEQYFFTYKTAFKKPVLNAGQKLFFHSKGIDYHYNIYLNGSKIYSHEGMFSYVDLDITDLMTENNEIKVTLRPVPMAGSDRKGDELNVAGFFRDNARKCAKPPVSYGWDWHPRLINRGIWDDTFLEVRNSSFISDAWVDYTLNKDFTNAHLTLKLEGKNLQGTTAKWVIRDEAKAIVLEKNIVFENNNPIIDADLKKIALWWPNGYGKPTLYTSTVEIYNKEKNVVNVHERKVGFKQVKLVMGEGTWTEPTVFPKSRSTAPATFEVNGKVIFAKGTNWVQPELFPGQVTKATYVPYIKFAKEANFNLLRAWGGGFVNKESFFDLCDENGLMVWQEFPLTGSIYPDDSSYLEVLKKESESIIKRVRPHACLALWCGGNELFNEWCGMTDQSLPLRMLNAQCYQYNPKTPFIATSPLFGMGHGHYVLFEKKNGGEVFQWMPNSKNTAYTEFGVPSVANVEVLKSFIPANEMFPPKLGTAWETHHAFNVWGQERWLEMPFLEEYFGKIKSLEDLVFYSQLSQCEGYKCIFEEARRQKPYCGMALNWCFQEPWPCAANNSLINWPAKPKPSLYQVGKACRPVLASARFPKFRWDEGDAFTCELFMLNDTYEKLAASKVSVMIIYDDNVLLNVLDWNFPGSVENTNFAGPTARIPLPKMKNNLFQVVIEVAGKPEYKSEYTFVYRGKNVSNSKPKTSYLNGVTD